MYPLLDTIQGPEDVRKLTEAQTEQLAAEIRDFLVCHVARTGGHLSANLGVVELTLALHRCFETPVDRIVFDVGHQSYVHKILTGRKDEFDRLRQKGGLSGFPKAQESAHDSFDTGHASTSVSAALGLAKARDLQGQKHFVVAVLGDGALTGGMAYEALNQAGRDKTPLIVVLNDNQMSIGPNVGALSRSLRGLRTKKSYLKFKLNLHRLLDKRDDSEDKGPVVRLIQRIKRRIKYFLLTGVFFEELGFTYLGPVDGNHLSEVEKILDQAKNLNKPVLVHIRTLKGKGYTPAEENSAAFHGIGPFDPETGECAVPSRSWADAVGSQLELMARQDRRLVAVTAAMPQGTGLEQFSKDFPRQFFDVGIAEEHAVTFSAGMAKGGLHPWVVIYSTFLQRAYDQILHDVCLPGLPVHLMLDHAGVVGEDGETHQGIFDIAYLGHIPGMQLMAPSCEEELRRMMAYAAACEGPTAIRYPKGKVANDMIERPLVIRGQGCVVRACEHPDYLILALGPCVQDALQAAEILRQKGIETEVADARFASALDPAWYHEMAARCGRILTVEDHIHQDGYGMKVRDLLYKQAEVRNLSLPDAFLKQGTRAELLRAAGICPEGIANLLEEWHEQE
ncbi:MAG: 1-deoxy-D-xylulose-5-phosphate synthase [Firmicutes bacterium]|nr:1-deoxy-D-xylulose-5-phosphate synthase [Bacillota bacterium]